MASLRGNVRGRMVWRHLDEGPEGGSNLGVGPSEAGWVGGRVGMGGYAVENLSACRVVCCRAGHGARLFDVAAVFALRAGRRDVGAVLVNCAVVVVDGLHVAGACGVCADEPAEGVADDDLRVAEWAGIASTYPLNWEQAELMPHALICRQGAAHKSLDLCARELKAHALN